MSIAIFSLVSCSSNDENLDPFVGSWYFFSENDIEMDNCSKKSTLTVLENGNLSSVNYGNQDNINKCVIENTLEAKWVNRENGDYTITRKNDNFKSTSKVIFTNNNNTFSTSATTTDGRTESTTFKRK